VRGLAVLTGRGDLELARRAARARHGVRARRGEAEQELGEHLGDDAGGRAVAAARTPRGTSGLRADRWRWGRTRCWRRADRIPRRSPSAARQAWRFGSWHWFRR